MRAAIEGIKQRGNTDLGDKTLLDALVPAVDELEAALPDGAAVAIERARPRRAENAEATQGHGRAARAGLLYRRAQPGLGRRRRDRHRGDVRSGEQGLAGGGAGAGLTVRAAGGLGGAGSDAGEIRQRDKRQVTREERW